MTLQDLANQMVDIARSAAEGTLSAEEARTRMRDALFRLRHLLYPEPGPAGPDPRLHDLHLASLILGKPPAHLRRWQEWGVTPEAFAKALLEAPRIEMKSFEKDLERYFEGCMPIEVLASRGPLSLAYGPMRPVGLRDPRTGKRPYAVVQLRQDDVAGTLYNLVGFQTNIRWGAQEKILRMIPGLERAEFVRLGQMHRNTFINSPMLLRPTLQSRQREDLFFAGQITGTEGYVGSTLGGLLAGVNASRLLAGEPLLELPPTTMSGALIHYVTHAEPRHFQPMKANLGLLPPLEERVRGKRERAAAYARRAMEDLAQVDFRALSVGP